MTPFLKKTYLVLKASPFENKKAPNPASWSLGVKNEKQQHIYEKHTAQYTVYLIA